jgi:hypothetical protein
MIIFASHCTLTYAVEAMSLNVIMKWLRTSGLRWQGKENPRTRVTGRGFEDGTGTLLPNVPRP